ncbi:universal stress protein [Nonomuraea sp. B12E4]|uniref:universal stress protein n=1 Tax=Nonomuraea sp. B12E4 TaxID=3153564 RepID=UPI00325F44BE
MCHTWQRPYGEGDPTARESLRRAAEHVLWHGADCARASSPGLDVRPDLYEGSATERLEALSADAGLLVVGSRGLGAVAEAVVGSVATHAVAHARCPVIAPLETQRGQRGTAEIFTTHGSHPPGRGSPCRRRKTLFPRRHDGTTHIGWLRRVAREHARIVLGG